MLLLTYLNAGYGFSGQNGGFSGVKFDPLAITRSDAPGFKAGDLQSTGCLSIRFVMGIVAEVGREAAVIDGTSLEGKQFSDKQAKAFGLLSRAVSRRRLI